MLARWVCVGFLLAACSAHDDRLAETAQPLVWTEEATLVPSNPGGTFGSVLDADGPLVAAGVASQDAVGPTSGTAYVFRKINGTWSQEVEISPPGLEEGDLLGSSVAIRGDLLAVGASADDDGAPDAGAVYVYHHGASWTLEKKIVAPDPGTSAAFGLSVALDGDTLAIGAPYGPSPGAKGVVYVYARNGGAWDLVQEIPGPADVPKAGFGFDVKLDAGTMLVATPVMWLNPSGIMGDGRAYVFVEDPATKQWTNQATLAPAQGGGILYGNVIALDGDVALLGVSSGLAPNGVAHVYERTGDIWSGPIDLTPQGLTGNDAFGFAVALDGGTAFVSAPAGDDNGDKSGRVHFFEAASAWSQTAIIHAASPVPGEAFGSELTQHGGTLAVGAFWAPPKGVAHVMTLQNGGGGAGGATSSASSTSASSTAASSTAASSSAASSTAASSTSASSGVGGGTTGGGGASSDDAESGDSGGCGCHTAPGGGGFSALLSLLALAAAAARRRPR